MDDTPALVVDDIEVPEGDTLVDYPVELLYLFGMVHLKLASVQVKKKTVTTLKII